MAGINEFYGLDLRDPTIEIANDKARGPDLDYTKSGFDGQSRGENSITSLTYGVPFWGDTPEAWDFVYFNHTRLPGIARIKGNIKRRKDPKRIPGKKGQKVTILGDDSAEVDIRVRLWTQDHLTDYASIVKALKMNIKKKAGTDGKDLADYPVVDVYHPSLNLHGIIHLHVLEFTILEPDGDGVYGTTIRCLQAVSDDEATKGGGVSSPKTGSSGKQITDFGKGAIGNKLAAEQSKPSVTNKGPNPTL